jgi:hypothetical protein
MTLSRRTFILTAATGAVTLTTFGSIYLQRKNEMTNKEALVVALENAIPFFKANRESIAGLFGAPPADIDEVLGEEFCAYVEWKEFDSWGLEGLNKTIPLAQNGITLSVDALYDDEGMPIDEEADEPYEFFMPTLQAQLEPHNLQLAEICTLKGKTIMAEENPRLVCIRTDKDILEALNAALRPVGLIFAA